MARKPTDKDPPKNKVATVDPKKTPPAPALTGNYLENLITRAALDPSFDVAKLKEIMALKNSEEDRNRLRDKEDREFRALSEFNKHMAMAQSEMSAVAAHTPNSATKSKYATYAQLDRAIRPIYTKHGFRISYGTTEGAQAGEVRVTARVSRLTHYEDYFIDMPNDGKGARGGDVMSKTHAQGAAITYGKRYLLGMIFNIAIAQDTDGNPPDEACSAKDAKKIREALADAQMDDERFLKWANIEAIEDLPASKVERALTAISTAKAERLKREREANEAAKKAQKEELP